MSTSQTTFSVKGILSVFAALGVLTGLTVLLSYANVSHQTGVILAGIISLLKVVLIAAYFMHLKWEGKGIVALVFTALFFVAVLVLAILPDIGVMQ